MLPLARFWDLQLSRGKHDVGVYPHPQVGLKGWACVERRRLCATARWLWGLARAELTAPYSPSSSGLAVLFTGSFGGSTIRSLYLATDKKKDRRGSKCPRISTAAPGSWAWKFLWEIAVGSPQGVRTPNLTSLTFSFSSLHTPCAPRKLMDACDFSHHLSIQGFQIFTSSQMALLAHKQNCLWEVFIGTSCRHFELNISKTKLHLPALLPVYLVSASGTATYPVLPARNVQAFLTSDLFFPV